MRLIVDAQRLRESRDDRPTSTRSTDSCRSTTSPSPGRAAPRVRDREKRQADPRDSRQVGSGERLVRLAGLRRVVRAVGVRGDEHGRLLEALRMMGGLNPVDLRTADTRLVLDGVERPDIGRPKGPPVFSPDGKRLAVPLEQTVVVDEQTGALYDGVASSSNQLQSGQPLRGLRRRTAQEVACGGGRRGRAGIQAVGGVWEFGQRALAFTPDSRQVIYKAEVDGGWVLVVDPGAPRPPTTGSRV